MLMVTNSLAETPDGLQLHPALHFLRDRLAGCRRTWFTASSYTPLSLFARWVGQPPAALVAARIDLPSDARQCWLASPFHARLMRDHLQVMPEGLFGWAADDAVDLAELLNPFLSDDGMSLHTTGAALILACREPMEAAPAAFAEVAGKVLPNRHPSGADGGRMMRLVSEIQMYLHHHRGNLKSAAADVSGLWFWGGIPLPLERSFSSLPSVTTLNPFLAAVTEGRNAQLTMSDAEQLERLINPASPLPRDSVLFGDGHALWLRPSPVATVVSRLQRTGSGLKQPDKLKHEEALWRMLQEWT